MNREVQVLQPRIEAIEDLPTTGVRALQMLKLLYAQAERHGVVLRPSFPTPSG